MNFMYMILLWQMLSSNYSRNYSRLGLYLKLGLNVFFRGAEIKIFQLYCCKALFICTQILCIHYCYKR
jgi:hypothetical protein